MAHSLESWEEGTSKSREVALAEGFRVSTFIRVKAHSLIFFDSLKAV